VEFPSGYRFLALGLVLLEFVGVEHDSVAYPAEVGQAQRVDFGDAVEKAAAFAQYDGEDRYAEFVGQVVSDQGAHEGVAAVDEDFALT
jgi:hypothetical protein